MSIKYPYKAYLRRYVGNRQLSLLEEELIIENEKDYKYYKRHFPTL